MLSRLAIERVMAALRAPALTPTTRDTALALLEKRVPRSWLDATRALELLPHLARGPSEQALALFGELVAHPSDAVRRAAWEHLMRLDAPLEADAAALGRPAEVVRAVAPLRPERSAQGGAVVLSLIDHVDARRFPSIVVGNLGLLTALGTARTPRPSAPSSSRTTIASSRPRSTRSRRSARPRS
ncbi:MAG: hypothetical protein U1F43_34910 [Myxococcota bacterium]